MSKPKNCKRNSSAKLTLEDEYPFSYLYTPVAKKLVEKVEKFAQEYEKRKNRKKINRKKYID